jgi:thiamine-monophosphate kinase
VITVADLTERELIARIQARVSIPSDRQTPPDWLVVGIGDDAAVVEPERNRLEVFTADSIVEGVHFDRRFTPPDAIGFRALAVNLSDLAAMGASPRLALLSMALPPSLERDVFDRIIDGFAALAERSRLQVIGGNLTRTPGPLLIDVTLVGTVKRRQALVRNGAKPGDEVYVSGTIGTAVAGLRMLKMDARTGAARDDACIARYLKPEPRLRLGTLLARNRAATACMDLSDGLADAVRQVAQASGVGMTIDASALPIDPAAHARLRASEQNDPGNADAEPLTAALASDDYELLFTISPKSRGRLRHVRRHADVNVTKIGVCTADRRLVLTSPSGAGFEELVLPDGYTHFG